MYFLICTQIKIELQFITVACFLVRQCFVYFVGQLVLNSSNIIIALNMFMTNKIKLLTLCVILDWFTFCVAIEVPTKSTSVAPEYTRN